MSVRLDLAARAGAFEPGPHLSVLLIEPQQALDMASLGAGKIRVEHATMPDAWTWQARGLLAEPDAAGPADIAVVFLPRSKQAARDRIARAASKAPRVLVDGQKTDGIEAILKEVQTRSHVLGTISKAHGKLFWFDGGEFTDWRARPERLEGRWHVTPGVFSADGVDPGSALLAEAVPPSLAGRIADLGAGWGYLAARVLERAGKIRELHLVEADAVALDCARRNVEDPRARFHWADATTWGEEGAMDAVLMNPPFHKGRKAEPDVGRAFIEAAARVLRPRGLLWMVANRHLPYEKDLRHLFAEVEEAGGDARFKVIRAMASGRKRR